MLNIINIHPVICPPPPLSSSYAIYISVSLSIIMGDSEGISIKRISPERGKYISPGQRPGYKIAVIFKP